MQKRGQATLLIILGILIVSSAILVYYFRDNIFASQWDKERAESLTVPEEAQELHDEISTCSEDLVTEALNLLGQQGGYITIPEDPIAQSDNNEFSNSLEIFPGSDFKTVYWFYEAANGVQKSQMPTEEYMAQELESYINENFAGCAGDFELFTKYNASAGAVSSEVEIQNDQVLFTINYPVHIAMDDFEFDMEKFYVVKDVPLGNIYQSAKEIMDDENVNYRFEDLTYDSLVLYDEVPSSWSGFDCEQQSWNVDEVEKSLNNILVNNVLAVKVRGTDYDINNEEEKNYYEWDMLDSNNNINVNMMASSSWPFQMEVYPTEGDELRSDVSSILGGLFCMSNYNFVYDIKYPVLVTLYDADSDYLFQFATQVILDNNQPRENELAVDVPVYEDEICGNDITPVSINVLQADEDGNLISLDGAKVSFKCINNLCPLGESNNGWLDTLVPQCVNGQIIAEKDGYEKGMEVVTTLEQSEIEIILEKYYNLSYDIKVIDLDGNARDIEDGEIFMVTLTEGEEDFSTTVYYPTESNSMLLIPGTYDVEGKAIGEMSFDMNVDLEDYTKCISVPQISLGGLFGLSPDTSCKDVSVEEQNINMALFGGSEGVWNLNRYELQDASHVTFYVTSPGYPENEDEAEEVYNYVDTGLGFEEPELS